MPHATDAVNGDLNSSKTISHIKSYPAVSDSIDTFKSYPIGKKSLELADSAYARFAKPVEPYLEKPYSYAKPYVSKADELGDRALQTVDGHFPIVKENTDTIFEKAKSTVFWPYTYLSETWDDEYSKTANHNGRGKGITTSVMAIVSLELRVASDFFHFVADNLRPAYEQTKSKADELTKTAQDKASDLTKSAQDKASDLTKSAQDTAGEYEKYGKEKYSDLKGEVSKKADEAKSTANKTVDDAKSTANQKTNEAKSEANKAKDKVQK